MCGTRLAYMEIFIILAVSVIFHAVFGIASCPGDKCLTGGIFFHSGKNMLENHALSGHLIGNVTVSRPVKCFEHCANDCRCISFNYLQSTAARDNCQLNEESRYTIHDALKPQYGSHYYELVIDYNRKVGAPCGHCQNRCCQNQVCLNGGTCHEICDAMGPRFICSCKPSFTGKFCETCLCPTGWLYFNSSCFKEYKTQLSWTDAEQACKSVNSALASIHSAEENEFIVRHVISADTTHASIGMNDRASEGNFVWTDGSDVTYTNWAANQPDDYWYGQDCSLMTLQRNGCWDDNICSYVSRYICRKRCT